MRQANGDAWVDMAIADRAVISDSNLGELDLEKAFDEVLDGILSAQTPSVVVPLRRRRVSRKAATLSIAIVLVAGAGAAAAVTSGAFTGHFPPPGATENGDTEVINFDAPNFPEVAHQLAGQDQRAGLRFAPGYNAEKNIDAVIQSYVRRAALQGSGETAEQQIKGQFAFAAACTWQRSWLAADARHDVPKKNAAVRGMVAITHVIVSSPGRKGTTITEAVLSGINQTRTQHELISDMEHDNVVHLTTDTVNGCPAAIK
jgi:hypothetical protein